MRRGLDMDTIVVATALPAMIVASIATATNRASYTGCEPELMARSAAPRAADRWPARSLQSGHSVPARPRPLGRARTTTVQP
jgi:hypothetical protein